MQNTARHSDLPPGPGYNPAVSSAAARAERRLSPRVSVDLWVQEHTDDALYFQRATSLSLDGLFLERTLSHGPGTAVTLELELPGEPARLRLQGVVASPRPGAQLGMGVRFTDLSVADRARLSAFLERAPLCVGPGAA